MLLVVSWLDLCAPHGKVSFNASPLTETLRYLVFFLWGKWSNLLVHYLKLNTINV